MYEDNIITCNSESELAKRLNRFVTLGNEVKFFSTVATTVLSLATKLWRNRIKYPALLTKVGHRLRGTNA